MNASPLLRARLPAAVALLAWLAFLGGALYGVASPLIWGHYGYHCGEYSMRVRHTLRNGSILPGNSPGFRPPRAEDIYLHHPILTHQLATLTVSILGDREYAYRGAGLLASFASLIGLTLLVYRRWGPWQGALAAWIFTLVPIDVWFANHIDQGFPSIACFLFFLYFYLRWLEDQRLRT